jgi:anti-sigma B factor antagonist
MALEVEIASNAGVAILRCRGRMVWGPEAAEFDTNFRSLLDSSKQIVLNLANVPQIDSGGVGALGTAFMAAHNRGAELKLASLSPRVADVLRITALDGLFRIYGSEAEAVEASQDAPATAGAA